MEKRLWQIERVKRGLWSFLVLLTFWPNNSLLWGCLMHWKVVSSPPGLYPLDTNSGRQTTSSKHPKSIPLLVNMKICLFFYGKNWTDFLANAVQSCVCYQILCPHNLSHRWREWVIFSIYAVFINYFNTYQYLRTFSIDLEKIRNGVRFQRKKYSNN